jgi:DNA (cytosine-5)-methyltransferase 1
MQTGHIDEAPIWDNLKTFKGSEWAGIVDFIFGGIPCQPHSTAGDMFGKSDKRELSDYFCKLVEDIRPRVTLLENVANYLNTGFENTISQMAELGYCSEWYVLSAYSQGAPHLRKRLWIISYPERNIKRLSELQIDFIRSYEKTQYGEATSLFVSNAKLSGRPQCSGKSATKKNKSFNVNNTWWAREPGIPRVVDGSPSWVDRLECIGNAWVPQVAAILGKRVREILCL